jgi:regulator of sigma E protease
MDEERIGYRDIILNIDGKGIYLETDYISALSGKKQGESVEVELLRKDSEGVWQRKSFSLVLQADGEFQNMTDSGKALTMLGLDTAQYAVTGVAVKQGFWETVGSVFVYSFKIGSTVLRSLGELLTGKIPISSMGGPVTTIGIAAQAAQSGMLPFLNIAAFIGVNLAVFNLLPVPALDGSKIVFCLIEWIRKKPINRKVETIIHFIGILVLFGFAILVDILQFI